MKIIVVVHPDNIIRLELQNTKSKRNYKCNKSQVDDNIAKLLFRDRRAMPDKGG